MLGYLRHFDLLIRSLAACFCLMSCFLASSMTCSVVLGVGGNIELYPPRKSMLPGATPVAG